MDVLSGAGIQALGMGSGAAIGAVTNEPCSTKEWLLCGPATGAEFGAIYGSTVTTVAAFVVAAVSKEHRPLALGTATAGLALMSILAIKTALTRKPTSPTPALGCPPLTEAELAEARAKGILPPA